MDYVDYYKVLGVDRSASPEEIGKAYRRLARKYHPDVNRSAGAEDQFKRINEAHQVLGDPEKRRRYDMLGAAWKDGQPFQPPPGWSGGGPFAYRTYSTGGDSGWSDFFETFFGGMDDPLGGGQAAGAAASGRRRRGGGRAEGFRSGIEDLFGDMFGRVRGRSRSGHPADSEGEVEISLEEAFRGGTRTVQSETGDGGRETFEIRIPPGARQGSRIRLRGRGAAGADGERGDVLLTVRIAPHPRFRIDGDDLVVAVRVAPWDAALGGPVTVPTPEGAVKMKLPAGRSSGDRLRLRGKGMPRRGGSRGDLYAEVRIVVPERLDEDERRLFEKLRETSRFRPDES
jgi:curved DNA-binding protein